MTAEDDESLEALEVGGRKFCIVLGEERQLERAATPSLALPSYRSLFSLYVELPEGEIEDRTATSADEESREESLARRVAELEALLAARERPVPGGESFVDAEGGEDGEELEEGSGDPMAALAGQLRHLWDVPTTAGAARATSGRAAEGLHSLGRRPEPRAAAIAPPAGTMNFAGFSGGLPAVPAKAPAASGPPGLEQIRPRAQVSRGP
jgi:hypothetical protein